jgi:hypothetical protein
MCLEKKKIYFVTRDRHIVKYSCDHTIESPFEDLGQFEFGNGEIKAIDSVTRCEHCLLHSTRESKPLITIYYI